MSHLTDQPSHSALPAAVGRSRPETVGCSLAAWCGQHASSAGPGVETVLLQQQGLVPASGSAAQPAFLAGDGRLGALGVQLRAHRAASRRRPGCMRNGAWTACWKSKGWGMAAGQVGQSCRKGGDAEGEGRVGRAPRKCKMGTRRCPSCRVAGPLAGRPWRLALRRACLYSWVRVSISILSPFSTKMGTDDFKTGADDLGRLQHLARGVALDGRDRSRSRAPRWWAVPPRWPCRRRTPLQRSCRLAGS